MLMLLKVKDRSMEPDFNEGDYLLVNKLAYLFKKPSKDDVIVFKHPKDKEKLLVKRVNFTTKSKCFVVGDNGESSIDSRHFGAIDKDLIVGKLFMHIKQ